MAHKKWQFREDMLNHCINGSSIRTFKNAEDRLNYLEEQHILPNMRDKVSEYVRELDAEINKCHAALGELPEDEPVAYTGLVVRIQTLSEVKNDLQGRLNELI